MRIPRENLTKKALITLETANLNITGPKQIGKTCFIGTLEEQLKQSDRYTYVVRWDFRTTEAIETKLDFQKKLASLFARTVGKQNEEAADYYLLCAEDGNPDDFKMGTQCIRNAGESIVVLYDDFLSGIKLLNDKYDWACWFRALGHDFEEDALRQVVVTPRNIDEHLRENAFNEADSNVADVFPQALRIDCFGDDFDSVISFFSDQGIEFEEGAKTDFRNWTGGVPHFIDLAFRFLKEQNPSGELINQRALNDLMGALESDENVIRLKNTLLRDCSPEEIDALSIVAGFRLKTRKATLDDIGNKQAVASLCSKGFLRRDNTKLIDQCKFIQADIEGEDGKWNNLKRLFGNTETYEDSIFNALKIRLQEIEQFDDTLHKNIENVFSGDTPNDCLKAVREVNVRILELIWDKELGQGVRIMKPDWVQYYNDNWGNEDFGEYIIRAKEIPADPTDQRKVLNHITGNCFYKKAPNPTLAAYVTEPTSSLIDFLHSVGNIGTHYKVGDAFNRYKDKGGRFNAHPAITESYLNGIRTTCLTLAESLKTDFQREPH